ncbi:MAG: hypothetical protein JST35_09135 [Armatimonadetes bacterium]|nr:hypothetical protein [Armatimonadota bacterium]
MIQNWMSWEGGTDFVAKTDPSLDQFNVLLHFGRMVHTPVGSAPSGMILWAPNGMGPDAIVGYVSEDPVVGAYFGPNVFAGTPFESAPVLNGKIEITDIEGGMRTRVEVAGHVFEFDLTDLGPTELIHRGMGEPMPFAQQGLEAAAGKASLRVNGEDVKIHVLEHGIAGNSGAIVSPCGVYAR